MLCVQCSMYSVTLYGMFFDWNVLCMECFLYGMFFVWNVLCMECSLYGMFFVWNVLCMECSLYGMFFVWNVLCMECSLYGMFFVWNVLCVECSLCRERVVACCYEGNIAFFYCEDVNLIFFPLQWTSLPIWRNNNDNDKCFIKHKVTQ